jgi:hypothetical protein
MAQHTSAQKSITIFALNLLDHTAEFMSHDQGWRPAVARVFERFQLGAADAAGEHP